MRELTLVMSHFQNLGMLAEHQKVWMSYPRDLRNRLHVVVVDDCSPKGYRPSRKIVNAEGLASLRLYRLLEKKRWNWLACRNLGAKLTTTAWMLLTDIDHVLPVETLRMMLDGPLTDSHVYRFGRVDAPRRWPYALADCRPYKHHPDTWLLTRAMFFCDGVFGYDEALSGLYGTSGEFKDRLLKTASAHELVRDVMIRYPREIIPDASTSPSVYTRKNDVINDNELEQRKAQRALIPGWRPLHGLIKYEEVYSSIPVLEEVTC